MQDLYKNKEKDLSIIMEGLSYERMSSYLDFSNNDKAAALNLYIYNTQISESFYTPLQGIEILLRNRVHKAISSTYGEDWLITQKFPFEFIQKNTLEETLRRSKIELTIPKLIAELNLGFWVSFFGRKYEEVWRHSLRTIVTPETRIIRRKDFHMDLNRVRELRNRIAHHEPIFKRQLFEDYETILTLCHMICPKTASWIATNSRFSKHYKPLESLVNS